MKKVNEQLHLVYLHRNKINGKVYVGQTKHIDDPNKRWRNGYGYLTTNYFGRAIEKYGWENFEHEILETNIPSSNIREREQYWIDYYDSCNNEKGYNVVGSQDPVMKQVYKDYWTEEKRKSQGERCKKQWQNNRQLMEQGLDKARAAFLQACQEDGIMSGENNPMYDVHRYGKDAPRRKKVRCINTNQEFNTVKEAAEWLGSLSQKSHISAVCKGKRNYCGLHPVTREKLKWGYVYDNGKNTDYEEG